MNHKRILFLFLFSFLLCGCQSPKNKENIPIQGQQQTEKTENFDTTFTGILRECNTQKKSITVYNIADKTDYIFDYTGGTDIKDKYDQIITMDQIILGEIVMLSYQSKTQRLVSLVISKEAWEYSKVKNLSIDKTLYRMQIASRNYWYEEGILLFSEGQEMELIDLNVKDEIMVKGIGSQICSIVVTTGHGYIRLYNYKDFVGGIIEVGYGIITPIVENMLIVAKEGKYKVVLENGELAAEKNINLKRNEEVALDLSKYRMPEERIGNIRFDIEPYGADLYVNGTEVDYSELVKLNYGRHNIQVVMNGYNEFNGRLTIGEPTKTISISLTEGTYEVAQEAESTSPTATPLGGGTQIEKEDTTIEVSNDTEDTENTENTKNTEKTGTTSIDRNHTITVNAPVGASLYFNGILKGTIPLSFTKEIGNQMVILSQSGYVTRSYSVEVIDDGENAVFNFPDMIQAD